MILYYFLRKKNIRKNVQADLLIIRPDICRPSGKLKIPLSFCSGIIFCLLPDRETLKVNPLVNSMPDRSLDDMISKRCKTL